MNNMKTSFYRGRFAPSPTGNLHFGSLIAALGSYCQARSSQGEWILRIEDVDSTRKIPGSADSIMRSLEILGFEWDGPVLYQSQRSERYAEILEQLVEQQDIFFCTCSRSQLAQNSSHSGVYPGYCRQQITPPEAEHAIRCRTADLTISFSDAIQGNLTFDLAKECGDFILKRKDGLFAYQLAVVVDDAEQSITEIVRGADLIENTPQQIYLQQRLALPTPKYIHLPVAMHKNGRKLSKSHQDLALDLIPPQQALVKAARFLNQHIPDTLLQAPINEIWHYLLDHWNINTIPKQRELTSEM